MKTINVGLIGCGFMSKAHSNAYRNATMWTDLPARVVHDVGSGGVCSDD